MANVRHTFAICAYGKSEYLTECIESVLNQEGVRSEVYIATSTPSDWLSDIANRYGLPVYVNDGEHGIGQDWNFAYSKATGDYVTIAHQDDVYCPGYAAEALRAVDESHAPVIFFSNYGELRNGIRVDDDRLLSVKRFLLRPLENRCNASSARAKRRAMAYGSAICCPAVTLCRKNVPNPPFKTSMRCDLDWDTWETLSRIPGDFLYSKKILMYHRIHEESTTTKLIENNVRGSEDLEMLSRFWPTPVARAINHFYSIGMNSNAV
ncbi:MULTISPECIES: glycosyltransferase family 2 protein [Atopobiaceae]|uniref:Glycosyl transferase family 2 n=1 Tax=Parafannyhessea umbonata TaxID=604330 RepID=A0A1H9N7M4_9ACTN|nr:MULTISPECIES: glycosyltransferase [Atopobiaceae]SEH38673.1 Glycosyl transferase family 2 [Parafannyhessea umbonata]SER31986.1 Glycosyl transferase family 2 [Parafannyhessea umbonata]SJZ41927.1 Glycosyl transferase family 2 [Olsenella sp. KH1P3]